MPKDRYDVRNLLPSQDQAYQTLNATCQTDEYKYNRVTDHERNHHQKLRIRATHCPDLPQ